MAAILKPKLKNKKHSAVAVVLNLEVWRQCEMMCKFYWKTSETMQKE